MFIVAYGTLITGSQTNASTYSGRIILQELAEAGLGKALYELNKNPEWASGTPYERVEEDLSDVRGRFLITFDPNEDYCSINNLTKPTSTSRSSKPGGNVPPYTAEIIIKASLVESNGSIKGSRYYAIQLVRGDFFDKHVSSEGPIIIRNLYKYMDTGTSDRGGAIHSNYNDEDDEKPAIKLLSESSLMEICLGSIRKKGIISSPGLIHKGPNVVLDSPSTVDPPLEKSSATPKGDLDINELISRGVAESSPVPVAPGEYKIEREAVYSGGDGLETMVFDHYTYKITHNGAEYNLNDHDSWARIDPDSGDFIIEKDIYVKPPSHPIPGHNHDIFRINFTYDDRKTRTGSDSPAIQSPQRPVAEGETVYEGPVNSNIPVVLFKDPNVIPDSYPTVFSRCKVEFINSSPSISSDPSVDSVVAPLMGTGAIICEKDLKAGIQKNHGALVLMSCEDINLEAIFEENITFSGFLYAKDDLHIVPSLAVDSWRPPDIGVEAPALTAPLTMYSGDINPDDNALDDPNNPVSLDINLPYRWITFENYSGYLKLIDEATKYNYAFPVKVKCYYEI